MPPYRLSLTNNVGHIDRRDTDNGDNYDEVLDNQDDPRGTMMSGTIMMMKMIMVKMKMIMMMMMMMMSLERCMKHRRSRGSGGILAAAA